MSEYRQLVEEFFLKYEYPTVDRLVVGFSGIDPPKKVQGSGLNHEELDGLLGGSEEDGHYHLTLEEWEAVRHLIENAGYDGGYATTTPEEYEAARDWWLDGGDTVSEHNGSKDGGNAYNDTAQE